MLQQLINHSPDIKKLNDEGYDIQIEGAFLCVNHIPYLNAGKEVKFGSMVMVLTLAAPNKTAAPQDHTVYFIGEKPCDTQGLPLNSIINNSSSQQLTPSIRIDHYFSSKPIGGKYSDFYEKIRTYCEIVSCHARIIDSNVTYRPNRPLMQIEQNQVFQYPDTNSARAGIESLNQCFYSQKIAIVGLGGTGSYLLDLISKTPVKEIHLFDGDAFLLHNAFRSPGAVDSNLIQAQSNFSKVNYYQQIYSKMHKGIIVHEHFIDNSNTPLLKGLDFIFICVDNNQARQIILKEISAYNIQFIDVGMGINRVDDSLIATLRITVGSSNKNDHLGQRIGKEDIEINEYAPNIQIADLNCLNAALAVIKWKKMLGFYQDLKKEHNTLYFVNTSKLINDDFAA